MIARRAAIAAVLALAIHGTVRAAGASVSIVDGAYQPPSVTITAGETVTWTNTGVESHTVTADDGSFDSGPLSTPRRRPRAPCRRNF